MPKKCYFVSDLHMFSQRSQKHLYEEAVPKVMESADVMILGGDIFDFRWSTLTSTRHTIDAAIDWLISLMELNSDCHLHYVLGNHDYNELLMQRLDELAADNSRFEWHRYYLQIGESVFLHGDVADRKISHQQLVQKRAQWTSHSIKGPISNRLYDLLIDMRLHKVANLVIHQHDAVVRRLMFYLLDVGFDLENDVRDVYFGHTHTSVDGYHVAGITFHNCGAPIKGVSFRIIEAKI